MEEKRDRQQPKDQYKEEENDQTDQDSSDWEKEDCQINFPTKRDLEKQYFLQPPIQDHDGKNGNSH